MDTREREYRIVLRSGWEHDPDEPWTETIHATNWREAVKHASGITDVLLVGLYPAGEEDRLREALRE